MMAAVPEFDRRRLLEVRGLYPALPVLVLHPMLTVVTGFGREASDRVVEALGRLGAPLGPAVTGTAEIGSRILELPGALSDPDTRPEVVRSPMIVGELARRRAAEAAVDLSQRAARVSRREAGLARRDQLVDRLERLSSRADALEERLHPGEAIDDTEIERLLAAARVRDASEPNPIVVALLDEWDTLVAERRSSGSGPTVERAEANLDAIRARIADRRSAVTDGTDTDILSAEGVARVQELHNALEQLAMSLEGGRRSERRAAGKEVSAALDAERDALAELGFDSYPSFLLAMAEGRAEDEADHDVAALQTAEAALERAREREAAFVVLSERELDLRARVARLLGRLPGPDVGADLRGGREALPESGAVERLEAALREAGIPAGDPFEAAERWLAGAEGRRAQRAALSAELAEIESEGCRLDEQLEQAEIELAAAERELIAGVGGSLAGREAPIALDAVAPDDLASALTALVAPAGPPVVVGECFTEVTPMGCATLLDVLAATSRRRQVIIVTEHADVAHWAEGLGGDAEVWTPEAARAAESEAREQLRTLETAVEIDAFAGAELETAEHDVEAEPFAAFSSTPLAEDAPTIEAADAPGGAFDDFFDGIDELDDVAPPPLDDVEDLEDIEDFEELSELEALDETPELPEPRQSPVSLVAPLPTEWETREFVARPENGVSDLGDRRRAAQLFDVEAVEAAEAAAARLAEIEALGAEPELADTEVAETEVAEPEATKAVAPPDFFGTTVAEPEAKPEAVAPLDFFGPRDAEPEPEPAVAEPEAAKAVEVPDFFAPRRVEPDVAEPEVAEAEPLEAVVVVQHEYVEADFDEFNQPADAVAEARVVEVEPDVAPRVARPKPPKAPKAPKAPPPPKIDGPWKAKRKARKGDTPLSLPWEGRFDTSRERELPGRVAPAIAPAPGSEPLAVCMRHRGVLTRQRCANCHMPSCDECLVAPRRRRGKPICIECAILVSGVRKRRRKGG